MENTKRNKFLKQLQKEKTPSNFNYREKQIEHQLCREVEKLGGKAYKFSSPSNKGVPDRIMLLNGECFFVECKRPGGKLTKLQKKEHEKIRSLGFRVIVVDSMEKARSIE